MTETKALLLSFPIHTHAYNSLIAFSTLQRIYSIWRDYSCCGLMQRAPQILIASTTHRRKLLLSQSFTNYK